LGLCPPHPPPPGAAVRTLDEPASTLFFGARGNDVSWVLRAGPRENATTRSLDEAAPTLRFGHQSDGVTWVAERPATTVAATARIAKPGHRDRANGERQFEGAIRIAVAEAAVLQSFPADYPFQGTKTAKFLQVGNAVPPLLALHVLSAATGADMTERAAPS
jgi:DNA (cytosine-5)-methyltransferase 1